MLDVVNSHMWWGAVQYYDGFFAESKTPPPRYDSKQSDDEVPVILELWGMRIIPSLP